MTFVKTGPIISGEKIFEADIGILRDRLSDQSSKKTLLEKRPFLKRIHEATPFPAVQISRPGGPRSIFWDVYNPILS